MVVKYIFGKRNYILQNFGLINKVSASSDAELWYNCYPRLNSFL